MSCELVENSFESKCELNCNLQVNPREIRYQNTGDLEEVKHNSQEDNIKLEDLNTALLKMTRKNIKKSNSSSTSTDDRIHHTGEHCLSKQTLHSNDLLSEQYTNFLHYHQHHIHSNDNRQSSKQQTTNYSSRFQKENTDSLNHQHHLSQNTNHKLHNVTANHHCHDEDEQSSEQLEDDEIQDLHLHEDDDDEYDESDDGIEEIEEDEGSYTDHDSTTTSTSTLHNIRNDDDKSEKGNCCNCCYCEVFGHGLPTKAPTSRNYDEIRDRLRIRLENKKQCRSGENDDLLNDHHLHKKTSQQFVNQAVGSNDLNRDERDLDELLKFINNETENTKCEKKNKKKREKKKKKSKPSDDEQLVQVDKHNEIVTKSLTTKHQVKCDNKLNNQYKSDNNQMNDQLDDQVSKSIIPNDQTNMDKKVIGKRSQCSKRAIKQDKRQQPVKQQNNCNGQRYTSSIEKSTSHCKKLSNNKDSLLDDVFLPKDIDYEDGAVVDEFEKELEEFKRFCFNSKPLPNKEKLNLDLKNIVIKKKGSNPANFPSKRNQPV